MSTETAAPYEVGDSSTLPREVRDPITGIDERITTSGWTQIVTMFSSRHPCLRAERP